MTYRPPKQHTEEELVEAWKLDNLVDAIHAEAQAENGPYYPEKGITKESLLRYAAECRRLAEDPAKTMPRFGRLT